MYGVANVLRNRMEICICVTVVHNKQLSNHKISPAIAPTGDTILFRTNAYFIRQYTDASKAGDAIRIFGI